MYKWQNNQLFAANEYNTSDVPGYSSVDGYNPGKLEPPDTDGELSNPNRRSNRSLYSQYRRPQRPENTHRERQKQTFAQRDVPDIKGGSALKRTSREQQDRINADYLVALELEREEVRRANLETSRLRAQLAEAKRERGYDEPRSGKVAMKVPVAERAQSVKKEKRKTRSADVPIAKLTNTRFGVVIGTDHGSSKLPEGSGLRRAMHGDRGSSDPSDSSSGTDDFGGNDLNHDLNSESDGSINYRGRNLFRKTPKSDHSSDSEGIRRRKREKRRRHRAKLQELKYQQSFLKQDPPFKYSGEIQASLFKKWVREVRDWIKRGRLSTQQGIELSGKYCGGRAYKFFERDILNARKKYLLAEYFEAMFVYLFPATFRMDQRDAFDACTQCDLSALDFLRQLQDIADTVGDLDENDIILGFWRRCRSYLKVRLAEAGLEPGRITMMELEDLVVRLEKAHLISEAAREHSDNDASEWSQVSDQGVNHEPNPESGTSGSLFGDKKRIQRLRNERRCFKCESKMHILASCPLMPEDGLLSSNGAKTDSDDGIGHSIDDQRDKFRYDPEDSDSPPLRNLRSGQSGKSSGESGNNSDDQNDSQVHSVSAPESNNEYEED
jgi:hypothetical protein